MQTNHKDADIPGNKLYDKLREQDVATLLAGLEEATNDAENIDSGLISAYLTVLEEKNPVLPPDYDPEEDLALFQEKFSVLLEEKDSTVVKKTGRRFPARLSRILGCAAVLVLLLAVCAEAFGVPIISSVYQWGTDAYRTVAWGPSGTMTLKDVPENEYASVEEALAAYGIQDAVNPHWIPSEFTVESVTARETSGGILIKGNYLGQEDKEILVRITVFLDAAETASFYEHEEGDTIYTKKGIDYILSENNAQNRAAWSTKNCICSINGNISAETLKRIIDSL